MERLSSLANTACECDDDYLVSLGREGDRNVGRFSEKPKRLRCPFLESAKQ